MARFEVVGIYWTFSVLVALSASGAAPSPTSGEVGGAKCRIKNAKNAKNAN